MRRKWLFLILLALLTAWSSSVRAVQKLPLTENDLLRLLEGGVYNARVAALVRDRGITFIPTNRDLESLRSAGADDALLHAVVTARRITPLTSSPSTLPRPSTANLSSKLEASHLAMSTSLSGPVPVGASITMQNWRDYQRYMPLGMIELFEGDHDWRMPPNIEIDVGPTIAEKLPARYTEATERYSGNVQVVHFRNGHNDIQNYAGGEPFPHPEEPDKGYKLLADLWFAYVPQLLVGTSHNPFTLCSQTANGYVSCERLSYVLRQLAYNTDGEASADEVNGNNYWYAEWISVEEPEESRYTTQLTL
jgi:hypothetical protein